MAKPKSKQNRLCGWAGCKAVAPSGELPAGWICIVGYRGPAALADLAYLPLPASSPECLLCPEHAEVFYSLFQRTPWKAAG